MNLNRDELLTLIDTITDLDSVDRFHGHSTIRKQSVAAHSSRVAMLAFSLAFEYYKNADDAYRVSTYALFHDFSEGILKNDANSAIKRRYGIRDLLKKLENDVVSDLFYSGTPMSNCVKSLILEDCSEQDYNILKLADTLDFGLFVWHEVGLGNSHIKHLLGSFDLEVRKYPPTLLSLPTAIETITKVLGTTQMRAVTCQTN